MAALPKGYSIRNGTSEDCVVLPAIEGAAAELFRPLNIISPELDFDTLPLAFLEKQCAAGMLLVATHEDVPVGFVVAMDKDGDFYIAELDVHPDHGKRGLGAGLMQAICSQAFEAGKPRVTLCTFRDVPWNAPFYARLGFTEITKSDWQPWMHDLAERQTNEGLDMETRVYMELLKA